MTNEERDLITRFIERVGGPAAPSGFGSVPSTTLGTSQALPPIDRDADALLAELFQKYPEARYRITQVAVVQEQALASATQRINALQAEIQRLQQAATQPAASPWGQGAAQPAPSRGLFGGLFGGSRPTPQPAYAPPPPPPQYAPPGYGQPGYAQQSGFQPRGTGFLGGALQTAAGVAGGVLAADALTSLFSGGGHGGGLFGGGSSAAAAPAESGWLPSAATETPWGAASPAGFTPDPFDQGGALKDSPASDPYADNTGWSPAPDTGWQDASGGGDSGWTDSSDSGWTDSSSDA